MGFLIGFGSTEQAFEEAEETAIREYVVAQYRADKLDYFTDAFTAKVRDWVVARSNELKAMDTSYRTAAEYPDRYGSYYATVLSDASNLVVILDFMHTNRRHAMSPDGWAAMTSKRIFYVNTWEDICRFDSAEQAA